MEELKKEDLDDYKKIKKLSKEIVKGKEVTFTAYLHKSEPKMGRSKIICLDLPKPFNYR